MSGDVFRLHRSGAGAAAASTGLRPGPYTAQGSLAAGSDPAPGPGVPQASSDGRRWLFAELEARPGSGQSCKGDPTGKEERKPWVVRQLGLLRAAWLRWGTSGMCGCAQSPLHRSKVGRHCPPAPAAGDRGLPRPLSQSCTCSP